MQEDKNKLNLDYPFLPPGFLDFTLSELELCNAKNKDYTNGKNPYGNFDRVSSILKLYPNFPYDTPEGLAVIYMLKQLDAAFWMMCEKYEGNVEGKQKRLEDVHVYTKIVRCILDRVKGVKNGKQNTQPE